MTPVALVTGGTRGIGLALAEALAGAGFAVAITSERGADDPEARAALDRLGPRARHVPHDLADTDAAAAVLDAVEGALGPVSAFVQNAGVPSAVRGDLLDLAPAHWDRTLGVNLRGAFFLAQAAARRMLAAPPGPYRSMTFVTSVSAALASPERADYCVSKTGLSMVARLFALRLAPHGIGVFELRPGIVATAMTAGVRDRYDARLADGLVPMGRWGEPADVGAVIGPIARGDLAFATGAAIPVDGGLSIARL